MHNVRLFFEKKDRAKYISHLDMSRCFQRAFKRSKLPVWYTQGFNPHMYLTFALPLSLGFESERESVDLRFTEELDLELAAKRLAACLPAGLRVLELAAPQEKPTAIASADYLLTVKTEDPAGWAAAFARFVQQERIVTQKRSKKKGMVEVDLKPSVHGCSAEAGEGEVQIRLNLPAGCSDNVNPTLLLDAFEQSAGFTADAVSLLRTRILTAKGVDFA